MQNAASVLRGTALTWWESLSLTDKPQTWNDMKFLMRETFVKPPPVLYSYDEVHHLEEESAVLPVAMTNLLQDNVHKREDNMEENKEHPTSCANSGPSCHDALSTTAAHESKDNIYGAPFTEGEKFDMLILFTFSARLIEQSLMDPAAQFLSLQEELCDDASLISATQLVHKFDNPIFEDGHADVRPIHCFNNEKEQLGSHASLISTSQLMRVFHNPIFENSHAYIGHIHCFDDERRKNETFRKEWTTLNVTILSPKTEMLQKNYFALPSIGTNILQHKDDDDMKDKEEVVDSDKSSLDVLNSSIDHAIMQQQLLQPSHDLTLSQVDLIHDPCDKKELCAKALLISLLQQMNEVDTSIFDSPTCAENKLFVPITCANEEQKLLSSINTLGYIEFDVLCNLNCLEKRLFTYSELPCLSRNTYHFIGKYNHKREYMVHRVYFCSNLKFSLVGQQSNQLEGCINTNHIKSSSSSFVFKKQKIFEEGKCWWMSPTISSTATAKPRMVCFQERENDEDMTCLDMTIETPSMLRTTFYQKVEDDENMTFSYATIRCKDKKP